MKYIVYLLAGVFFAASAKGAESKSVNANAFKVVQEQDVQKKEDSIKMIAGLPWHSDIDTAYALAQKENKQVIIMVEEDYCKWCTKMKKSTFTDTRIKAKLEKYILVAVKRSDKSAIKHVPSFDGNIPSLFFMKSNREMIEPVVGYFVPDDLLSYIKEIEEL